MPDDAFGARSLRRGFTRSEALDRAFALGWPHLRVVGDDPLADALPKGGTRWCYSVAEGLAEVRPKLAAAGLTKAESGLASADALAFARHVVSFGCLRGFDETHFFLLEGVVGAEVLAEAMVVAVEEISRNEWKRAHRDALSPYYWLGFALLRTEANAAEALRARLAAVHAKNGDEGGPLTAAIDLVIHGATGARRSAPRCFGEGDASIQSRFALFVDDDPAFVTAVTRSAGYVRAVGARLAFLGDATALEPVVARYYAVGTAAEQAYFLETVGQIEGEAMVTATREAVRSSKVKDAAAAWLEARGLSPQPAPPAPGAVRPATLTTCNGDYEFGFVLIAAEAAEQLQGPDDHTVLSVDADPTTTDAVAAHAYGANGVFFCLADNVALVHTDDGALVVHGGTIAEDAFGLDQLTAAAASVDWIPVTTLELPSGRLVGQLADVTLAEAREGANTIETTLPAGRYDVRRARHDEDADDEGALPPMLWLRRMAP